MAQTTTNTTTPKICPVCGKEFVHKNRSFVRQVYCSLDCREYNRSKRDEDLDTGLSVGTIGCVHDYTVAIDLLRKGWEVFMALSPNHTCDLVAINGNKILRMKVVKGRRDNWDALLKREQVKIKKYDILALSFTDGEIDYRPPLPAVQVKK